jgi:hypothetical protein
VSARDVAACVRLLALATVRLVVAELRSRREPPPPQRTTWHHEGEVRA